MKTLKASPRNISDNEQGSVLMLALGVTTVLAVAVGAGFTHSTTNQTYFQNMRLTATRNSLIANVSRYASLGATYRSSINPTLAGLPNLALQTCILSGAVACSSGTELPVSLYYPNSSGGLTQLTGTAAAPAYYDIKGAACTPTAKMTCPFKLTSTFIPTCGSGSSCAIADSFQIHYNLATTTTGTNSFPLATIDQYGAPTPLSAILPPIPGSAAGNVLASSALSSDSTTDTTTTETPAQIIAGYLAQAGIKGKKESRAITEALNGNTTNAQAIIDAIAAAGVTNAQSASTLAAAGITNSSIDSVLNQSYLLGWDTNPSDIQTYATMLSSVSTAPDAVQVALVNTGVNDPTQAQKIASAVAGVTNVDMAAALVEYQETSASNAQAVIAATAGITDPTIQLALVTGQVSNAAQASAIAAGIVAAGVTNPNVMAAIAFAGITSPSLDSQMEDADIESGWDGRAIVQNIGLTSNPALQAAIVAGDVTNGNVAAAIIKDGITNPAVAAGLQDGDIENAATAAAVAKAVTSSTITDPTLMEATVTAGITNSAVASTLQAAQNAGIIPTNDYWTDLQYAKNIAGVTNVAVAAAINSVNPYSDSASISTVAQAGITSSVVANAIVNNDITSVATATAINNAVATAGASTPDAVAVIVAQYMPATPPSNTSGSTSTTTVATTTSTTTGSSGTSTTGSSGGTNNTSTTGITVCTSGCGVNSM